MHSPPSTAAALVLALITAPVAPGSAVAPEDTRIVLFGAHWCAPCTAELADLPRIAAAAGAERLELAWIDRAPRLVALPANVALLDPAAARALAGAAAGDGYGLPLAARFVGAERPCAVWPGRLRAEDVARLRALCASGPAAR